jgi:cytochrome c556
MPFLQFLALPAVLLMLAAPLAGARAADDTENQDPPVQYRIDVMKGISYNAAGIGVVLRYKLPQTQNIALHADAIAIGARAALTAFAPKVAGGVAKPNVWENWKDFSDRLTKLAAAADDVAASARAGGADPAKINTMFGMCKNCHDEYRKK